MYVRRPTREVVLGGLLGLAAERFWVVLLYGIHTDKHGRFGYSMRMNLHLDESEEAGINC